MEEGRESIIFVFDSLIAQENRSTRQDSFVEEYAEGEIRINFDFGIYSNNFGDWPKDTSFEKLTVDGKSARIGTVKHEFREGFPYSTQIYIKLDQYVALSMFAACKSEKEVSLARRIFETIDFRST